MDQIVALDVFAGTGWGVACKWLGIEEKGVELMAEAVATREANGMETVYRDVWDGLLLSRSEHARLYGIYTMLIGSPPCQTFSVAGHGAGRAALTEVIEAIQLHAYKDPQLLLEFGEKHDMRTALVLAPLAYVYRDMPQYVVLEQVPTVLPVWEAYAEVMRDLGYDVKTAILNAEQYGVPQTRRRAILVARLDGPVKLPTPTHSRYYTRDPERLDPGVAKWVSMAEALGWGHETPAPTVCYRPEIAPRGCKHLAPGCCSNYPGKPGHQYPDGTVKITVGEASALQTFPKFTQNNKLAHQARRTLDHPAPTITAGHDSGNRGFLDAEGNLTIATPEQVAALQSYPTGRGLMDRPSPTITGGGTETGGAEPIAKFHERYTGAPGWIGSTERLSTAEAATLQSYPTMLRSNYGTSGDAQNRGERTSGQPAPTLTSKANRNKWDGETGMEPGEASALQSYAEPFKWCGSRTKQFLQIGNAVPPVLAHAVLSALIEDPKPTAARRRTIRKLV